MKIKQLISDTFYTNLNGQVFYKKQNSIAYCCPDFQAYVCTASLLPHLPDYLHSFLLATHLFLFPFSSLLNPLEFQKPYKTI